MAIVSLPSDYGKFYRQHSVLIFLALTEELVQ